jgi:hypothetical protein
MRVPQPILCANWSRPVERARSVCLCMYHLDFVVALDLTEQLSRIFCITSQSLDFTSHTRIS